MLPRIFTFAIIAFWLGSLGWLCAVVWAPPESRMAQVDPREVYEVFFAWNESTRMTLLENGSRKGELNISGGSGIDRKTGEYSNSLSLAGTIDTIDPTNDFPGIDLNWRGLAEFDRDIVFQSGDFSLRIAGLGLNAHMALEGEPLAAKATVSMSEIPVFRYDSTQTDLNAGSLKALPFASMLGSNFPIAELLEEEGEVDPSRVSPEIDARMGTFSFGGRDLRAYLLKIGTRDNEGSIRIFLSEVGEPLRIETDFGLEAVSEILMPLDAYLNKNESDTDDRN